MLTVHVSFKEITGYKLEFMLLYVKKYDIAGLNEDVILSGTPPTGDGEYVLSCP